MMMKSFSHLLKYKMHIIFFLLIVLLIFVSMNYEKMIEGFTSCTQPTTCSQCVNAKIGSTSSPCYWNQTDSNCGSFLDASYSSTCPSCTTYTTCSSCIGNGCYWDASTNKCGPDLSGNYKNTCPLPFCNIFTDCSSCIGGDSSCYWNSQDKTCKLNGGNGYARVCDDDDDTCGNFIKLPFDDVFIQNQTS